MKFVICVHAMNYNSSNGILSLIVLCAEMRKRGLRASLCVQDMTKDFSLIPIRKVLSDTSYHESEAVRNFIIKMGILISEYDISIIDPSEINTSEDIILYPEVIINNPLNADKIVRYFGNREGYLVDGSISKDQPCFNLAHSTLTHPNPDHILFFSHINKEFKRNESIDLENRSIDLTYVGKGHLYHKNPIAVSNTFEIARTWPKEKNQLAYILSKTRFMFTYDVYTNLNLEAIICGAIPIFLIDKPFTDEEIDSGEIGSIPRIKYGQKINESTITDFFIERENLFMRLDLIQESYQKGVDEFIIKLEKRFGSIDRNGEIEHASTTLEIMKKAKDLLTVFTK